MARSVKRLGVKSAPRVPPHRCIAKFRRTSHEYGSIRPPTQPHHRRDPRRAGGSRRRGVRAAFHRRREQASRLRSAAAGYARSGAADRETGSDDLGRVLGPPGSGGARRRALAGRRRRQVGALRRGRARDARPAPRHDRPRSVRRRSRARAGTSCVGAGAPDLHEKRARSREAQAALTSAKLNLSYTRVRAPVSGRVGRLEVTVGNLVPAGPGAPVLTTLVSVNPIYASFDADEHVVLKVLADGKRDVPVEAETVTNGGRKLKGRLQLIDNQVNTRSGTVRVRAVFDNKDGSLIAGQYVKLRMGRAKAEPAILVSERAIGTDQDKRFVFVVGADDKAVWRQITLGGTANGQRIVTAGLEPGERIVVNGLQRVRPGALLAPQEAK